VTALAVRELTAGAGPDGRPVLRDLCLEVAPGHTVAVLGRCGAGKSLLVRALCGLTPSTGEVQVGGVCRTRGWEAVRARLGVLLAQPGLLDDVNVFDNVAWGLRRAGRTEDHVRTVVDALLGRLGLRGAATLLPAQLSGGMRRRAALARALSREPACLLLDDPTAGLDPVTAAATTRLILDAAREHGAAVVLTTHDLSRVAAAAGRVVLLAGGALHPLGEEKSSWIKALAA
jgi:phospholipid/cholesterol/gamma-HCH transport system ATP-binding protein